MTDIASLGLEIDSTQVDTATVATTRLTEAAAKAERQAANWTATQAKFATATGGVSSEVSRASAEAEKFIAALKFQADTLGMTALQIKGFTGDQMKLTDAQQASAVASVQAISAFEKHETAVKNYTRAALAGAAAAVGLAVAFAHKVMKSIDAEAHLQSLSERTGIVASKLATLSYAAAQSDTSIEVLAHSMTRLSRSLVEAQNKNSAAGRGFAFLEIDPKTIKTQEQAMDAIADALKRVQDPMARTAALQMVMKEGGERLLPFFLQGSEGIARMRREGEYWNNISDISAQRAKELKDEMVTLEYASGMFARSVANDVVPQLIQMIKQFLQARKDGEGFFASMAAGFMPASDPSTVARDRIAKSTAEMLKLQNQLDMIGEESNSGAATGRVDKLGKSRVEDAREILRARIAAEYAITTEARNFLKLEEDAEKRKEKVKDPIKGSPLGGRTTTGGGPKAHDDYASQLRTIMESNAVEEQRLTIGRNLTDVEKTLLKLQTDYSLGLTGRTAKEQANLLVQAEAAGTLKKKNDVTIDMIRLQAEADAQSGQATSANRRSELENLNKTIAALEEHNAKIGKTKEQIELLTAAEYDRAIAIVETTRANAELFGESTDHYDEEIKKLRQIQNLTRESAMLEKNAEEAKKYADAWKTAAKDMQRAMSGFFEDVMEGNLKNLGQSFQKYINKMVADVLAAKAQIALFGGDFQKTGEFGGLIGAGMKALGIGGGGSRLAAAAADSAQFGIPMAAGGDFMVNRPTLFLAGEAGPERATFSPGGGRGGGQQVSVTNVFQISGPIDRRSQAQIAAAAGEGVQRAMARNT